MKKEKTTKSNLHPRNLHKEGYDFDELIETYPDLEPHVGLNKYGNDSIDFFDPYAVKALNKALLLHFYKLDYWDIPAENLCPPIPGRADYIHNVADLLAYSNKGKIPKGPHIKCLDVGVGANCVYPIIGQYIYKWSFIGSEVNSKSAKWAKKIVQKNKHLSEKVDIRWQPNKDTIFGGILKLTELVDVTICNPPFYSSAKTAEAATIRKLKNLKKGKVKAPVRNFSGVENELWYEGGEVQFIKNIIGQSKGYASTCFWFTTLVSKESNLKIFYQQLEKLKAVEAREIPMGQGNKKSRILAWTFLDEKQQRAWRNSRWSL